MDQLSLMKHRHSVRQYTDRALEPAAVEALQTEIAAVNAESRLRLRLITEEPTAFQGPLAHYGKFRGVKNYLILAGPKVPDLEEKIGCCGQRLVLKAAELGLDSCWVALTFRKRAVRKASDGKLVCAVALGYGENHGIPHKSKPIDQLCQAEGEMPSWFLRGMEGAALAPTAMNQQKFRIHLSADGGVRVENLGGAYSRVDLGIVKYQFKQAAGAENFHWAD